ncbi:hypothetical protein [Burkholderia multivorans]|uniref:hypothetical protein n=1 Tax=Burkholderia multivorans TaxID=87883 RepID=UPI0020184DF6|nr:hypothetical protein [Burkholderia multivorans]MCO1384484.1 hypothetical protein [Burkholderia multivorans]MCO1399878.1 hypothetical protein [Burkholderia multivorans]UQO81063.1 hypothetical protein L0Z12_21710 [Burkholderia multivorans]
MDRLIAPNTVTAAQADTAPATGTPGYATDGNPASNIPATRWPAYQYNAIQEELMAIIAGGGLTPDRTDNAQILAAIRALIQASSPVVGQSRNLAMSVAAASATQTVTAEEVVVGTSLGGLKYTLNNFSQTINLATTGAGGMDVGSAPTSGFVGIYAIYNPTSGASALLATNATAAKVPEVYGGTGMPAGYTASALVSVWPTNSSGQFVVGCQVDRYVNIPNAIAVNTTGPVSSYTLVGASSIIPKNAKSISGELNIASTNATGVSVSIAPVNASVGAQQLACSTNSSSSNANCPFNDIPVVTPQSFYWQVSVASGTLSQAYVVIGAYRF